MRRVLPFIVACAAAAHAQPYDYLPFRMISTAQNPWPYYVDTRLSNPAGLSVDSMRAAADQAWKTWNNVTCASPKVLARGASTGVVARAQDPYDVFSVTPVWFTSQDSDFSFIFGSGYVASVSLPVSWAGVLQTCDTYFNAAQLQWSTDAVTPRSMYDVETVMLHEAGHCLGLNHLGGGDIMYFSVEPAKNQHTLGNGDVGALCERNPAANQVGAPCGAGDTCGNGLTCVLQPTQNGVQLKLCTSGCTVGSNGGCPLPMTCQPSTAISGFSGACQLPGSSVTRVGQPCTAPSECGSSVSVCRTPVAAPSGGGVFWANGYCSQGCEQGQALCPAGSSCLEFSPTEHACLQACRVGLADCRPEYACMATSDTTGACVPRCYADRDCADTTLYFCRVCDGLCVARNNVTGQIGDGCATDEQCGQGQICRAVITGGVKTCTQQCARGCGVCPQGSSCTPLAGGDLFCIRDCSGPGTCPAGLRCADTVNGKGCVPACSNDLDCAVGQHCYLGECYTPSDDAGCGALCAPVDAGKPIVVTPKDAGTGGGGSGGCGCTSADSSMPWLLLGALIIFVTRRQAWRAQ